MSDEAAQKTRTVEIPAQGEMEADQTPNSDVPMEGTEADENELIKTTGSALEKIIEVNI